MTDRTAGPLIFIGWGVACALLVAGALAGCVSGHWVAFFGCYLGAAAVLYGAIWNYLHFWSDRSDG